VYDCPKRRFFGRWVRHRIWYTTAEPNIPSPPPQRMRDRAGGEMEHRCPQCASLQMTRVRDGAFVFEWRCTGCGHLFADPRLSVVFVDDNDNRRQKLVQCLEREGIPVVSAGSVAELEGWPIGKVLVTHARAVTPLWFDMGAAHVVVLADSDEERALERVLVSPVGQQLAERLARPRSGVEQEPLMDRTPVLDDVGEQRTGMLARVRYRRALAKTTGDDIAVACTASRFGPRMARRATSGVPARMRPA